MTVNTAEQNPGEQRCTTTLFVRNIPFTVGKSEVEAYFAEWGPLQNLILIQGKQILPSSSPATIDKEKDEQSEAIHGHAGYGFVKFALAEDAKKCCDAHNNRAHGQPMAKCGGRRLKVEFALRKHAEINAPKKKEVKKDKKEEKNESQSNKATKEEAKVFVKVSGDALLTSKALEARLRKGAKPKTISALRESVYLVTFYSLAEAQRALKKCSERPFIIQPKKSTTSTKKEESKSILVHEEKCLPKFTLEMVLDDATLKGHRLIIRNLPFTSSLEDVEQACASHGTILHIEMPPHPSDSTLKHRGFAFVQFLKKGEAEQAMLALNGTKIGRRPVAVDWALSQKVYKRAASASVSNEQGEETRASSASKRVAIQDDD